MDEKKKKDFPRGKVPALRPGPNEKQLLTQLKAGDVAENVLMTVLWDYSSEEVAKYFDTAQKVADTTEYVTYTGKYKGVPISVISTGSGSPTLVDALDELVEVGAKTIIRIGCSGAIQEDIKVGDLVITSGGVRSEGASKDYIPLEYPAVANYEVVMSLVQAAEENDYRYHVGLTRSHASFYVGEGRPGPNSNQKFAQDTIKRLDRKTTLLVDGAYYSEEIAKKVKSKNIKMVPTSLVGRSKNTGYEKFDVDEKKHTVKKCPSGHKPIVSTFKKGSYRAHFDNKHCSNCPLHKDCPVVKQKKNYLFKVSETKLHRSKAYRQNEDLRVLRVSQKKSRDRRYPLNTKEEVQDRSSDGKGRSTCKGVVRV